MKVDAALPYPPSLVQTRVADDLQLVRPRLALLVLVTVTTGWVLAAGGEPNWLPLVHALIGTALLFAGATTLNQLLQRHRLTLSRVGTRRSAAKKPTAPALARNLLTHFTQHGFPCREDVLEPLVPDSPY